MVIQLHMNKNDISEAKKSEIHSMPCKIDLDDTADVSKFMKPFIKVSDDKSYFTTSFRGYPLEGKKISIPKGYTGFTFFEYKKPEMENAGRNIYATTTFTEFTYWNYDKMPSRSDPFIVALDWIEIAEALHTTEEDNSESK